jgi:dihydrofolate reductase
MRKIIVGAQLSIDGVMQAPGAPTEDPTGGFQLGGWAAPYFNKEFGEEIDHLFRNFDLLLGRKTYEIFAAYWPYYDHNAEDGKIARMFDQVTKYAVSRTGEVDTGWDKTVLLRDIAAVQALKETDGPDLVTQGSTDLVHSLLAHDLVDAISTYTLPVVLGRGKRLFIDGAAPRSFKLVRSRIADSGLVVAHYERAGKVETASVPSVSVSDREQRRQERMAREG